MAEGNGEFPTILGADTVFKGELRFQKGVRLLGQFEGEVNSEGDLTVAEGASLEGQVNAGSVRIEGHVRGNLNAGTKIQLTSSGRLEGDITTSRLEVADGAVLIGRCSVGAVNDLPRKAATPLHGANPASSHSTPPTVPPMQPVAANANDASRPPTPPPLRR